MPEVEDDEEAAPQPENKQGEGSLPPRPKKAGKTVKTGGGGGGMMPGKKSLSAAELASGERYKYQSTQFEVTGDAADKLLELQDAIDVADLGDEGFELEPHITCRYGLEGCTVQDVAEAVRGFGPLKVRLGETKVFEQDDCDVLVVAVVGAKIHRLNKLLADLPHVDKQKQYKPHVTVAYLLPGCGEKYAGDDLLAGTELSFDAVTFCDLDGTHAEVSLLEPVVVQQELTSELSLYDPDLGEWAERIATAPAADVERWLARAKSLSGAELANGNGHAVKKKSARAESDAKLLERVEKLEAELTAVKSRPKRVRVVRDDDGFIKETITEPVE